MSSIFIHCFTFFIRLILIDFPEDKDKSSILKFEDFFIDFNVFNNILDNFRAYIHFFSGKDLEIITFNKSSVGRSIPISMKLLILISNLKVQNYFALKVDSYLSK